MNWSLESIEALTAVADTGSFAAAAATLHKVPSAVSYQIKQLERSLGVELFDQAIDGDRADDLVDGLLDLPSLVLVHDGRHPLALDLEAAHDGTGQHLAAVTDHEVAVQVADLLYRKRGTRALGVLAETHLIRYIPDGLDELLEIARREALTDERRWQAASVVLDASWSSAAHRRRPGRAAARAPCTRRRVGRTA